MATFNKYVQIGEPLATNDAVTEGKTSTASPVKSLLS